MRYVFNTEGDNEILGPFYREADGVVEYEVPGAAVKSAPADCVEVREVTRAEIVAEFDRFIRLIERAKDWVVDGGYGDTGLNSVVAAGVEMTEYAHVMGAALTTKDAEDDVRRRVESGHYYVGARAHSRALEEDA